MSSIKMNKQFFKNEKGCLTQAKKGLNCALNEVSTMDIPSSLYGEEANFLRNIDGKIREIISSVNHYCDWVDYSISQVDDMIIELHREVEKIQESKIEEKGNSVLLK